MVPSDRPQLTKHYGAKNMGFACSTTKARIHTHRALLVLILIVNGSTKYFVARQKCRGNIFLHFHGNTEHSLLLTATLLATRIKRELHVCCLALYRSQSHVSVQPPSSDLYVSKFILHIVGPPHLLAYILIFCKHNFGISLRLSWHVVAYGCSISPCHFALWSFVLGEYVAGVRCFDFCC
jgi:hypothetical protein